MAITSMSEAMELLTGPEAGAVLHAALNASGSTLDDFEIRGVHRRGSSTVSVVYRAVTTSKGDQRTMQLVAHASKRSVPEGASVLMVDGCRIHVWRVPYDPYLVGLPSAVDRGRVREFLDRVDGPGGSVRTKMRSYRPTRRAVVEVSLPDQSARAMYLKVLGGSTPERILEATGRVAETHRRLSASLPVPHLIGASESQGILALAARPGRTLRSLVLDDGPLPEPSVFVSLTQRLRHIDVPSGNDPRRYANIDRHVRHLGRLLPDSAAALKRVAAAVERIGGPRGTVHGDFHDGQVLFDEQARLTGILDVDGTGVGNLASDAGRLISYVEAAGLVRDIGSRADEYAQSLFEAYSEIIEPRAVIRGAAAAWVGLATGPYRSQRPDWQDRTRQRIERAVRWVARLN